MSPDVHGMPVGAVQGEPVFGYPDFSLGHSEAERGSRGASDGSRQRCPGGRCQGKHPVCPIGSQAGCQQVG